MKSFIFLICFLVPSFVSLKAEQSNLVQTKKLFCDKNPLMCQIVKNNPKINLNYAYELSNIIYKKATKHNINPRKFAAILAQESMYRLDAKNCKNGVCNDFGIAQINKKTIEAFGFDKQRLLKDLEYSIEAGVLVLADFKRMYGDKEQYWWTRYNASNPEKRKIYKQLVMRFL